jgi:hypothetical protein
VLFRLGLRPHNKLWVGAPPLNRFNPLYAYTVKHRIGGQPPSHNGSGDDLTDE